MPLFYQHNINESSRIGIWKVEETEDFFLKKVFLQREISHPHKRLQHLAGRYLLQFLFDDFPHELIMIADTRKPFLSNDAYHFSISHCGNFAAAIVSRRSRVGVDIELVKPMIEKIKHKFLSDVELELLFRGPAITDEVTAGRGEIQPELSSLFLLTLCWSGKESIYKWYGNGGVDFKAHMQLNKPINFYDEAFIVSPYIFRKEEELMLTVLSKTFDELVMSYVIS